MSRLATATGATAKAEAAIDRRATRGATAPDGARRGGGAGPAATARGAAAEAGAAGRPSRAPDYSLLAPPDYDNIVGGVAPSPFVSLLLLAGIVTLVAAAVGSVAGLQTTEWWLLGALLLAVAAFLAGFISRGA
jgi:hypothetical protein